MQQKEKWPKYILIGVVVFLVMLYLLFNSGIFTYEATWEPSETMYPFLVGTEDCRPPCWRDLLVGETTYDEIYDYFIDPSTNTEPEKLTFQESGVFFIEDGYSVSLLFSENLLYSIMFDLHSGRTWDTGSVVHYFGEPDYYSNDQDQYGYYPILYYSDLGLIFHANQDFSPLDERMMVNTIFFVDIPATQEKYKTISQIVYGSAHITPILEWDGFGTCPSGISCN